MNFQYFLRVFCRLCAIGCTVFGLLDTACAESVAPRSSVNAPLATADIMKPDAVILHIHDEIEDTGFLPHLERKLRERLSPPVTAQTVALDIQPLRGNGLIDARLLIDRLAGAIDWEKNRRIVHVFVVKDDFRLPPANFNFAVSAGTASSPFHVVVVSLARLQESRLFDAKRDSSSARTAERVYKMVAKNVAKVSGYAGGTRCLFSFPRNLAELDATAEGFCEPDLSILSAAGIARQLR